jgi:hypothetical protein
MWSTRTSSHFLQSTSLILLVDVLPDAFVTVVHINIRCHELPTIVSPSYRADTTDNGARSKHNARESFLSNPLRNSQRTSDDYFGDTG